MRNEKIVKVSISVALATVLFAGCGDSTPPATAGGNAKAVQSQSSSKTTEILKSEVSKSLNSITGKIMVDAKPLNDRNTHTLTKEMYSVTAYNLDDNSVYKTTTDASGVYSLSGLSDGEYQIYAQNDEIAKSDIQRVSLKRGTKKVVDFVLQAAGSLKGRIIGAEVVFIPGKDFVSLADENGNFELTNIPVGNYKLGYEGEDRNGMDIKGMIDVSVEQGMKDLALITPTLELFHIDTSLDYGVLELHHDGIGIEIKGKVDLKKLAETVTLKNSAGEEFETDILFDNYNVEREYDYFFQRAKIRTKEIVPAGSYTLTIPSSVSDMLDADIVKTFQADAVSVAFVKNERGGGARYIDFILPKDLNDSTKATFGTPLVKEKGSTSSLGIKAVWIKDNELALFGNYKTGVEYVVELSNAQKAVAGEVKSFENRLAFDKTSINDIYPQNGREEVSLNEKLYVNVTNIGELDPSSVKITLSDGMDTKVYQKGDIEFSSSNFSVDQKYPYDMTNEPYDFYDGSYGIISIAKADLAYGKTYTMKVEAKDIFGNPLVKESTFTTLTPTIRSLSPHNLDELFSGYLRAEFNVGVQKDSGKITIDDLSDPSASVKVVMPDDNDYYGERTIAFEFDGLKPLHKYKVTAAGYKTLDGEEIPSKSTEFTAPVKMLFIDEMYKQNLFVNPQNFEHKVKFFVFGGLSDAEKEFMRNHLRVTSFGDINTPDATHPTRKLFFLNDSNGVEVVVAFTIDPDTNYEVSFDDVSGLSGIVMPRGFEAGKPLVSFSTMTQKNQNTAMTTSLIKDMRLFSDGAQAFMSLDVEVPLGNIPSYESCWSRFENERFEFAQNLPKYITVTDEGGKEVPVEVDQNTMWDISSRYMQNNTQNCILRPSGHWDEMDNSYKNGVNAHFFVDYNTTYTATVDFSQDFSDSGYSALKLSKQLVTKPIGELDFWVDDNGGRDAILFHVRSNAPFVNPEVLKVVMDGKEYRVNMDFYEGVGSSTDGDANTSGDMDIQSIDQPMYGDLIFELPRPIYSLIEFSLTKDDGTVLKFFNPSTESEIQRADLLTAPKIFTQSVSPDFIPVKVESVHTLSAKNKFVVVEFNRMMNMSDIVTYTDVNKTEISDIAFEVKDSDGNQVAITFVDSNYNSVGFELANELNVSKTYTISLKEGKTIQSAFGVQKLSNFSHTIEPVLLETSNAVLGNKNYAFDLSKVYQMGSTDEMRAMYVNSNFMTIDLNVADGVKIDVDKSFVNVYSYGDKLSDGQFTIEGNRIVQPLTNNMYGDIKANINLTYLFNSQEKEYEKSFEYMAFAPKTAELYSVVGNGVNSLVFNFQMDPASISEANFKIFDQDGNPVQNAALSVQVNPDNPMSATLTFDNLANDTIYRIDVVGLSAYGDYVASDALVSRLFIKTVANQ